MSIARAFTLRNKRSGRDAPPSPALPLDHAAASSSPPGRGGAVRRMASIIDRSQISAPIELISTTNMLSYNAPDVSVIRNMRQPSSSASSSSGEDSDVSSPARSSSELTDASSLSSSSPTSPEGNHLSGYFKAAQDEATQSHQKEPRRSASTANFHYKTPSTVDPNAPAIPQRALSHSKSAHMHLARKRSMQSISSVQSGASASPNHAKDGSVSVRSMHSTGTQHAPSASRSSSFREQRQSADFFKVAPEPNHPFGKELEQLNEVAEELGGTMRDAEAKDDLRVMREQGLAKWSAADYLQELKPLYLGSFGSRNHPAAVTPQWI